MWIYRSRAGETAVRSWCQRRLDDRLPDHRRELWPGPAGTEYHAAHLVIAGEQHDRTVVLLPGRHANAATLADLIAVLATRRRVVAVDLPGEPGLGSGGWPNTDRMRDYGDWIDDLLVDVARRSPGGVTVLGHEFGAAVALAARPAPHLRGLVLAGPTGVVRRAWTPQVAAALAAWRGARGRSGAQRLLTTLAGPGWQPQSELVEWLDLVGRHVAMSSTPPPRPEWVPRWREVPSVVAVGEHDPVLGDGRLVEPVRRLLHTDVVTVPGAGALLPYECPETVAGLLDRLEARAATIGVPDTVAR
ncbi:alpha/beta fold hydrolase [Pseudonocardia parietis]|uniref:Sulfur carrier protein ThiS n=1 Tax=Pseudonocardia parietis TaxID=570936 RepID=A0ABS4W403_9PSEU|nr:alpha/beta hydrolase [Pseudonocardia parietis]MBP2370947.1 sulfur carrier protein ThiS [Pseudonocardia parietis]